MLKIALWIVIGLFLFSLSEGCTMVSGSPNGYYEETGLVCE